MTRPSERTVELLYFAAVADLVGRAAESVVLPEPVTCVARLSEYLQDVRPNLRGRLEGVRFAVNEAFADAQTPIASGDVVALLPPSSGG